MSRATKKKPRETIQPIARMVPLIGSLGLSIRTERKNAGLTLQSLADQAGFSISYLSQIERNLLVPSISTLRRIAGILKIPAGQLILAEGKMSRTPPLTVIRRNDRKRLSFPGSPIVYELLTPDLRRRASLMWVMAPPGSESGPSFSHEGEDGVVVLKGVIEIEFGEIWHQLNAGDSMYFSAEIPHRWRNSSRNIAEAIWLSTPPAF